MAGFLYQTTYAVKRARQQRDRKRECERQRVAGNERVSTIKQTLRENICGRCLRLISEVIKMLLMMLFP
jgi:hypothetical protein